jgi:hypothetical protein
MTTRRQFVQTGLVLAAAPLAPFAVAAQPAAAPAVALDRFVYDVRFAVAESFAAAAGRRGVPLAAFAGDLTELWYRDLDLAWRRRPETIGGATTAHGLFVLETLAMDRRMHVVAREDRGLVNGEQLFTWLIAPRTAPTPLS